MNNHNCNKSAPIETITISGRDYLFQRSKRWLHVLGSAAGVALVMGSSAASAQTVKCSALRNPLFLAGSTALEPLYKAIGKSLATDPDPQKQLTLAYLSNGSCAGISALSTNQTAAFSFIDDTYDGTTVPTCINDIAGGIPLDVALSDVAYETCTSAPAPASLGDYLGPAASMLFVTPKASSQTAISAEEAYYLLGFGQFGDVQPWNRESLVCVRSSTSGTQRLIAANIAVPSTRWLGKTNSGSADVVTCLNTAQTQDPERTLGILGTEVFATGTIRQTYKALAFRGFGQARAYLPDSSATTQDKRNLRDGRYLLFGQVHMITASSQGVPTSARARQFIDLVTGKTSSSAILTSLIRNAKLVPSCAMHVTRTGDGGQLSLSPSPTPCDCFFELTATGTAPASCQKCTADTECASKHCRNSFCEPR
jgi:ABC-type phosphate transport system substrate-binding protein